MRVYLDMRSIKRPFDDQLQPRVNLEAVGVDALLHLCASGDVELVSSDGLLFENSRNPNQQRREWAAAILALAGAAVPNSPAIEGRAEELVSGGLGLLDSLHLSFAEASGAEVFCTCDDELARRGRAAGAGVEVLSPPELVRRLQP